MFEHNNEKIMNDRNDVLVSSKITFCYRTEFKFDKKKIMCSSWLTHTPKYVYIKNYTKWTIQYILGKILRFV